MARLPVADSVSHPVSSAQGDKHVQNAIRPLRGHIYLSQCVRRNVFLDLHQSTADVTRVSHRVPPAQMADQRSARVVMVARVDNSCSEIGAWRHVQ